MSKRRIDKVIVWVFFICIGVCSCKSSKDSAGTTGVVQVSSPEAFVSRGKFTWFQGGKGQSISGTVKMQRDERIQISLVAPVLRTEAVRIEATLEQVLVIDRINKQYAVAPVSELHLLLGNQMDYTRLQTILSEAVFMQGASGWMMRQGGVDVVIPIGNTHGTEKLLLEMNRIEVPRQAIAPTNPSSRYEKKELSEVIESIEQL